MPEVTGTVLALRHQHPRDARITFQEDGHVYTVDGEAGTYTSVTTLVHKFFPHFDADKVIPKIIGNPKSQYFGMTPDAVKEQWNNATSLGSQLHEQIEVFFDRLAETGGVAETPAASVEFGYFLDYFRDHVLNKLQPYRTEWYVFDQDIRVCGSIDMLFCDKDDSSKIWIHDWKRSSKISRTNRFEKGLRCLSHLDSCNYIHYCLQLNMYKYILEAQYDKTVMGMALVVLHPNQTSYQVIEVKDMQDEIAKMLACKDTPEEMPAVSGNPLRYLQ
jgi:hypothetical protein